MSPAPATPAALALGSNLEPRNSHLDRAVAELARAPGVRLLRASRWIQSEPVGLDGAAEPAQGMYLNGACTLETTLPPEALLELCLEIERAHGRDRLKEGRYGARTLDLDVLLYGDRSIQLPNLVIPHPRMLTRAFVLEPLCEIAGQWTIPSTKRTVQSHWEELKGQT
ncbi:MAG: 2-amino-4-hydroxy-6-hydroxymethyldihydropteridine diphosphokinase [Phycisphaerales bacterium]|nr:2-amino-4-hydroxy-6-hydroxymethyldihydropteridine diphosphokinase [Planctomycetota bacterium]